jgi:hypothetical protein
MKASSIFVTVSFLSLLVSFWNRNELPGSIDYVPELQNEPVQKKTREKPFETTYEDTSYLVEPQFEYDLYGMVVSFRHHEGNSRMHMLSSDHLNMMDVCVIWGDNIANPRLDKIDFWNGIFTCNVKTRDQAAWDAFDMYKLSNNHLISDDEFIRDQVQDIHVGDQIRVSGYLASYVTEVGGTRGTSTTRLDTGNGACETLFVKRFQIVQSATSYWRISMYGSLAVFLLSLFAHFRQPYRPYRE